MVVIVCSTVPYGLSRPARGRRAVLRDLFAADKSAGGGGSDGWGPRSLGNTRRSATFWMKTLDEQKVGGRCNLDSVRGTELLCVLHPLSSLETLIRSHSGETESSVLVSSCV